MRASTIECCGLMVVDGEFRLIIAQRGCAHWLHESSCVMCYRRQVWLLRRVRDSVCPAQLRAVGRDHCTDQPI